MVKSALIEIHPLATTAGALALSVTLFALIWFLFDRSLPYQQWQARAT